MAATLKLLFSRHAAWLGIALGIVAATFAQTDALVVFSLTGEWSQVGPGSQRKPLHWLQPVYARNGNLVGVVDSELVLKTNSGKLFSFKCDRNTMKLTSCVVSLKDVELKASDSGFFKDVSEAFARLTTHQPEKYMIASSRGIDDELSDALVSLNGGQIELRDVFHGMSSGKYYLAFSSIDVATTPSQPLPVTYAKGLSLTIPANQIHEGLYRIALVDAQGEPAGSDAWILVASAATYPSKSAAYERAVNDSRKLPEEMDPAATRALLRAYLESLASPKS
jgi:hypothetical protein